MNEKEMLIRDIPEQERPYEKCLQFGPEGLTDAELLAVILRTGIRGKGALSLARNILSMHENSLIGLNRLTLEEVMSLPGVGKVRAVQILCITEMAGRMSRQRYADDAAIFRSPEDAAAYYMEYMRHKDREELLAVFLNTKGRRIKEVSVSVGTVNSSQVPTREIFVEALRYQAVSVLLLHNHPSGDPEPSHEDILATRRLQAAAMLVGINLLDHIIIGDNCYISLKERGIVANE